ncbi:XAP5, circadian clock regulator-domain-containing protein [Lipomyces orientalis]|uniref:XAP5, circadian clock regulator-domain-containing protein n=1 Tax=Lipomyces orientalis TaxID=1233043 RepID=A0ACC3TM36_9ASCO
MSLSNFGRPPSLQDAEKTCQRQQEQEDSAGNLLRNRGSASSSTGIREFETQLVSVEDIIKNEAVGLVDREKLKRLREDLLAKRRDEESTSRSESEAARSGSEAASDSDVRLTKRAKKKRGLQKSKLSFADGEEEDREEIDQTKNEGKPVVKKLRKVDPTVDTSFLKTKEAEELDRQNREQLRKEFLRRQEEIKEEKVELQFCYFDGTYTPGKVTVKKGDQIWVMLDRTRKGKKELHRGTVDDIMFVKDNIVIPHHYDFYYFILNKVKSKAGFLFDFDSPDEDIKRSKVVHRTWYEKNKHIFPASIWQEFDPEVDYSTLVLRDSQGFVLYQQ